MKKILLLGILALLSFLIIGCTNSTTENVVFKESLNLETYSIKGVSQHNSAEDCWIILEDYVLNMTGFITAGKHKPIDQLCGKDMTDALNTKHPGKIESTKEKYIIGKIK